MKKVFWAFALATAVSGLAAPDWEFEIVKEKEDVVEIVSPQWIESDSGLLLTCRLEAPADRLVKPVSHLLFTGENAEGKPVWTFTRNVFRKSFDKNYGSRVAAFTRVAMEDIPSEVRKVKVQFVNEPPPSD